MNYVVLELWWYKIRTSYLLKVVLSSKEKKTRKRTAGTFVAHKKLTISSIKYQWAKILKWYTYHLGPVSLSFNQLHYFFDFLSLMCTLLPWFFCQHIKTFSQKKTQISSTSLILSVFLFCRWSSLWYENNESCRISERSHGCLGPRR